MVELLAFAAPHEELGEVVGVAAVCDKARTLTLAQVRRAGNKSGMLERRWLPELLVLLPSLPKKGWIDEYRQMPSASCAWGDRLRHAAAPRTIF